MKRSVQLEESLLRNRQRVAAQKLRSPLKTILSELVQFADPMFSKLVDSTIKGKLAQRRSQRNGDLVITRNPDEFKAAINDYFDERRALTFLVFLWRWSEAGALKLLGSNIATGASQLLCLDGDSVYGCTADETQVFSLDRTVDDGGTAIFELFYFIRSDDCIERTEWK
jgi:hypothetical protein